MHAWSITYAANVLRLLDPCYPDNCQPAYSYHHIVNLTGDNALFEVYIASNTHYSTVDTWIKIYKAALNFSEEGRSAAHFW